MICPICSSQVQHLEGHHIIPREYGGQDLEQVNICSTCHHGLHHQANAYWTALQKGESEPARMYFSHDVWEKAAPYVAAILQARKDFEDAGRPQVRPRRLIIEVPQELLVDLHRLKKYHGYTSLSRFIKDQLQLLVTTSL